MLSHPVCSCITIHILELHVWIFIVWMVMHRNTCLEYERLFVVFTNYVQFPIIKMSIMGII